MTNLLFTSLLIPSSKYKKMKNTGRINKQVKTNKLDAKGARGYYFHADEDFREDWDWGKSKVVASKAISKPVNKFEI